MSVNYSESSATTLPALRRVSWGATGNATAALWTFITLLLGAIAAGGGANVGVNRVAVAHEQTVVR